MSTHTNHPQPRSIRGPRVRWTLAAALLAATVLASAHERTASSPPESAPMTMDHSRMGNADAHAGMSMTGDVDYDFAVNMRKHHQMALMMAEAQLSNGEDATLRAMATQIIAAQKQEIAELDRWIGAHDRAEASRRGD